MQANYKATLLDRIAALSGDIAELRRVRIQIAAGGVASATLSAGGGSKSYTRLDLNTVTNLIRTLDAELASLRARLNGGFGIRRIVCTRGGW